MYIKPGHLGTDRLSSPRLRPKFHLPLFTTNPATPTSNLFLEIMGYTLGYGLEGLEFEFQQEQGIFLFSKPPNRLRVPPNLLLINGYQG